jgi:tetratricopeptide (TPR) repeat protein
MDSNFLACYANRAACYLKLELYPQCKADCDIVIQRSNAQLNNIAPVKGEEEPDTAKQERMKLLASLIKTYCRRGAALCQLGQFTESMTDYCQALAKYQLLSGSAVSLLPNVTMDSIQSDIDRLKLLCNVENTKKEGDRLFSEQNLQAALEKYNQSLAILPVHVSSLSNRAACKLALGDIESAIEDCQIAVDLLQYSDPNVEGKVLPKGLGSGGAYGMLTAILPPVGSVKRKQWLLKTIARQAMALVQLDRIVEAIKVYEVALKVEPNDEQLKADFEKLKGAQKEKEGSNKAQSSAEECQQ